MRHLVLAGVLTPLAIFAACAPSPLPSPAPPGPLPAASAPSVDPSPAGPIADASVSVEDAAPDGAHAVADPAAELAWARERWPQALAPVDTERHAAELSAWVSAGSEVKIWFTGEKLRCRPGVAKPSATEGELDLKVFVTQKRTKGVRVRDFVSGTAGHLLWFGGGGGSERQLADGTWEESGAWGKSDQPPLGVLAHVDPVVAHFSGMLVDISAWCDGPLQQLACPGGGKRDCDTCKDVKLQIQERPMGMLGLGSMAARAATTDCACPDAPNPDVARANALFRGLEAWTSKAPGAGVVAVYRSAAACKADGRKP